MGGVTKRKGYNYYAIAFVLYILARQKSSM